MYLDVGDAKVRSRWPWWLAMVERWIDATDIPHCFVRSLAALRRKEEEKGGRERRKRKEEEEGGRGRRKRKEEEKGGRGMRKVPAVSQTGRRCGQRMNRYSMYCTVHCILYTVYCIHCMRLTIEPQESTYVCMYVCMYVCTYAHTE